MDGPKIVFSGYYGFNNAGDELVLSALTRGLKARLPDAKIVVLSASPAQTAATYGVDAADRFDREAVRRAIAGASLFVSGGGSLLQDKTSVRSLFYYTALMLYARKMGVPVFVAAQGLGPLTHWYSRKWTAYVLNKCEKTSWRDEDSAALADAIGIHPAKIMLTCDPVLAWQPEEDSSRLPPAARDIIFALRPWPGFEVVEMALCADILVQSGRRVAFLPLGGDEDMAVARAVTSLMHASAEIIGPDNLNDVWHIIGAGRLVVGMRLHALIVAAAQGVPAVAIDYDPKVASFAHEAGQPVGMVAAAADGTALAEQILSGGGGPRQEKKAFWQQMSVELFDALAASASKSG